jgi:hypothetical protein
VRILLPSLIRHPVYFLGVDVTDGAGDAPSLRITTAIPPL